MKQDKSSVMPLKRFYGTKEKVDVLFGVLNRGV